MKKFILPLFAALALAACGENMDGKDGSDATDTTENALQEAGNDAMQSVENATDTVGARIDRATDNVDLHNDKNDADGKDTLRN